ncbi:MAG: hypothetical protein HZA80_00360 [Candidatus Taylorbacteria bacterium]|nr:hypothetical protein [Candidatus Taylorbacteria bacterium]
MKRFLLIVSLALTLGIAGVAQTPSSNSVSLATQLPLGTAERLEENARSRITYLTVFLWFTDSTKLIKEFTPVRFDSTSEDLETFVPRVLGEKLALLNSLAITNTGRPIQLAYKFVDSRLIMLFFGTAEFTLENRNGQCSAPLDVEYNWQLRPGYATGFGMHVPGIVKAHLVAQDGTNTLFDKEIDRNTNDNGFGIMSTIDYLFLPPEAITNGYNGELTIWVKDGSDPSGLRMATYDLQTGVRTSPIHLTMTAYYQGVTIKITGSPGKSVALCRSTTLGETPTVFQTFILDSGGATTVHISTEDTDSVTGFFSAKYVASDSAKR